MRNSWTEDEIQKLKLSVNEKVSQLAIIFNRSEASIADKLQRLKSLDKKNHLKPYSIEEDTALLNGMKNREFCEKYERGSKEVNQRRFDLKHNLVLPGETKKKNQNQTVEIPAQQLTTREINSQRPVLTPFSKKEFREEVIRQNRLMFNISEDKSAMVSTYQNSIMLSIIGHISQSQSLTMFRKPEAEFNAVITAYNILTAKHNNK